MTVLIATFASQPARVLDAIERDKTRTGHDLLKRVTVLASSSLTGREVADARTVVTGPAYEVMLVIAVLAYEGEDNLLGVVRL